MKRFGSGDTGPVARAIDQVLSPPGNRADPAMLRAPKRKTRSEAGPLERGPQHPDLALDGVPRGGGRWPGFQSDGHLPGPPKLSGPGGTLHLVQSDIRRLPFEDNTFDFVYTMGTIEHIGKYRDAVHEVHRVLNPEGKAIIGVPHKWNVFLRPLLVKILELLGKYPYSLEKSFSYGELRRLVEGSGLRTRRRTGILAFPDGLRMLELFLYQQGVPLYKLISLMFMPFEYVESRWEWARFFGYLIALEAEKPAIRSPTTAMT